MLQLMHIQTKMGIHPSFLSPIPMVGLLLLLLVFLITPSSSAGEGEGEVVSKPSLLVDKICKQVSNYTFCVDALYSDPRAYSPDADSQVLAYISFGLAYLNATSTCSQITKDLLSNGTGIEDQAPLRRCQLEYRKAVSATEEAYEDLDSETYSSLGVLAGIASHSAAACEGAFKGTGRPSPLALALAERNTGLIRLCEICVVVSNLFI